MKKVGIICSGGDAPGMNPCLRAAVLAGKKNGLQVVGFKNGYEGIIDHQVHKFSTSDLDLMVHNGGALIGSSRSERFKTAAGRAEAYKSLKENNFEGLIAIGGDGTCTGAQVFQQEFDFPIICLPGTIDNDLFGTDATIGYDSALNTVVDAIDKIRDTAGSHKRFFFVEVMGRDAGFIALRSGIASGAHAVFVPEFHNEMEQLMPSLKQAKQEGRSAIIVVSEGDEEGGALQVSNKIKAEHPDYDCKVTILGHLQRGGRPSVFDRVLAARMGAEAVVRLLNGDQTGMLGLEHKDLRLVPLDKAIKQHKSLNQGLVNLLSQLQGS